MDIQKLGKVTNKDIFFTERYMLAIRNLITYYEEKGVIKLVGIEPLIGVKYRGDFLGLLDYLNVPVRFHSITLMINDLLSTTDYDGESLEIKLFADIDPDSVINLLRKV